MFVILFNSCRSWQNNLEVAELWLCDTEKSQFFSLNIQKSKDMQKNMILRSLN